MNAEVIPEVCFETSAYVSDSIRGVVLSFHGLGAPPLRETPNDEELELAQAGILVVYPYCGPWTWMNRATREFVDDLVDAIYERHSLRASVPLAAWEASPPSSTLDMREEPFREPSRSAQFAIWWRTSESVRISLGQFVSPSAAIKRISQPYSTSTRRSSRLRPCRTSPTRSLTRPAIPQ